MRSHIHTYSFFVAPNTELHTHRLIVWCELNNVHTQIFSWHRSSLANPRFSVSYRRVEVSFNIGYCHNNITDELTMFRLLFVKEIESQRLI